MSEVIGVCWANGERTIIKAVIKHIEYGVGEFIADPNDCVQYGKDVYANAINGEYGPIGPYDDGITLESTSMMIRHTRDTLLSELDALVTNPLRFAELSVDTQAALAIYRTELLNVPYQEGFPYDVVWPVMPVLA